MGNDRKAPENDRFSDEFDRQNMAEFYDTVAKRFCPECGEAFKRNPMGRPKQFCSEKCRRAWHRKHIHPEKWKKAERKFCPICGCVFIAAESKNRKYCSHACANRARARKEDKEP